MTPLASASPKDVALVTPEGVALNFRIASGATRLGAFMIDQVLIGVTMIVLTLLLLLALFGSGFAGAEGAAVVWLLAGFLIRNAWFILWELTPRAATPAKRWLGLRVASRDGGPLTAGAVVSRNLLREIEWGLPIAFLFSAAGTDQLSGALALLGLGWTGLFLAFPLFNKQRLRLGDVVAGTWVLEAKRPPLAADLAAGPAAAAVPAFTRAQLDAYGVLELHALEDVLRKPDAESLATVAAAIRNRIGWRGRENDRAFLDAYYAALRNHQERGLNVGRRRADKHAA